MGSLGFLYLRWALRVLTFEVSSLCFDLYGRTFRVQSFEVGSLGCELRGGHLGF